MPYCCVGIMMFPLNSIVKGTFPNTFRTKLCLCKPVLKENIVAQNIVTLTSQVLASIICAYWTFKINQLLRSLCPRKKMSCIGNFRRNFTTLNQTTGYIKFNSYYDLLHQRIVFRVSQVAFKVTSETNVFISMITDFL